MDEKARHIAVGITALIGLAGVMGLMLLFGYLPQWLEGGYEIRVRLANASGLIDSSRVKLNGIDIGRVTDVRLEEPPRHGTIVTILIRETIRVPDNARVKAESPLLGGSPTLAFEMDKVDPNEQIEWIPDDGSAVVQGEALTMVSQFAGELQAAISEPTKMMGKLVDHVEQVSTEWTQVGHNLNMLLEQREMAAVESGEAAANLSSVLTRADQRLAELKPVIDGVDRWVNDSKLLEELLVAVKSARDVAEKLSVVADQTSTLVESTDQRMAQLAGRFIGVADDLSGVVGRIGSVARKVDEGNGTAGKLVNDPALYNNLNDCAVRLGLLLDEARLMVAKWKAEGLPVQF